MKLIYIDPNPSGGYPPILEGDYPAVPEGMAIWPEDLNTDAFYEYNGFVTLNIGEQEIVEEQEYTESTFVVTSYEPNVTAWEAWKATLPTEPYVSEEEDIVAMLIDQEYRLTLLELGITNEEV